MAKILDYENEDKMQVFPRSYGGTPNLIPFSEFIKTLGNKNNNYVLPKTESTIPTRINNNNAVENLDVLPKKETQPINVSSYPKGYTFINEDLNKLYPTGGESATGTYSEPNREITSSMRDAYSRALDSYLNTLERRDIMDRAAKMDYELYRNALLRNALTAQQLDTGMGHFAQMAKGKRTEPVVPIPDIGDIASAAQALRQYDIEKQRQNLETEKVLMNLGFGKAQIAEIMAKINEINRSTAAKPSTFEETKELAAIGRPTVPIQKEADVNIGDILRAAIVEEETLEGKKKAFNKDIFDALMKELYYNKNKSSETNKIGMDTMPPASEHKNKIIRDDIGNRYISDGERWIPIK